MMVTENLSCSTGIFDERLGACYRWVFPIAFGIDAKTEWYCYCKDNGFIFKSKRFYFDRIGTLIVDISIKFITLFVSIMKEIRCPREGW